MNELLMALRAPTQRRSLAGIAAAVTAVLAAGGLWLHARSQLCSRMRVASVWGDAQRERVRAALSASSLPFAAQTLSSVEGAFAAYAQDWRVQHREACAATRLQGTQSEEVMALRMRCLDGRLHEWRALVALLSSPDEQLARNAVDAVQALGPIAACADVAGLRAADRGPPVTDETRAQVDEVEAKLGEIRALRVAGKYDRGLALVAGPGAGHRHVALAQLGGRAPVSRGADIAPAGTGQRGREHAARRVPRGRGQRPGRPPGPGGHLARGADRVAADEGRRGLAVGPARRGGTGAAGG